MLTIQNISRRMQVYTLDAPEFQEAGGEHGYRTIHTIVVDHDRRSGALSARRLPRNVPSSLTFAAGEIKHGLPNSLQTVAAIAGALQRRELRVLATTPDSETEGPKPSDAQESDKS